MLASVSGMCDQATSSAVIARQDADALAAESADAGPSVPQRQKLRIHVRLLRRWPFKCCWKNPCLQMRISGLRALMLHFSLCLDLLQTGAFIVMLLSPGAGCGGLCNQPVGCILHMGWDRQCPPLTEVRSFSSHSDCFPC